MIVSWCGIVTEGRPPSIHAEREGDTHYGETSEAPWSTLHKLAALALTSLPALLRVISQRKQSTIMFQPLELQITRTSTKIAYQTQNP